MRPLAALPALACLTIVLLAGAISPVPPEAVADGSVRDAAVLATLGDPLTGGETSPDPGAAETLRQAQATQGVLLERNVGQWDGRALFRARANGYDAFVTATGLAMVQVQAPDAPPHEPAVPGEAPETVQSWATHLTLVGGNPAPPVTTSQPADYRTNYFIGNDPGQWHTDVPTYTQVTLHGVYPGIDLTYHAGPDGGLKYDFIVHPGADPSAIQQRIDGATVALDTDGTLALTTGLGGIHHGLPVTMQADGQSVANHYRVIGDTASFDVGAYDLAQDLVIDPLVYSTFLGGPGEDDSEGIAVDSSGNAYVTGTTSSGYPVTSGAYDMAYGGNWDAFVTKVDAAGSLVYSTFLGGNDVDEGYGIAVDSSGNAHVVGVTESTNYPATSGAYRTTHSGGFEDVFVTTLNVAGSGLVSSTYLGGGGRHFGYAIALDSSGNAYVTGTTSSYYPTTVGAYDATYGGGWDAFMTKVDAAGGLLYSTFLGGSGEDTGVGISVDPVGNVYIVGMTESMNYPTTAGAYDTGYNGRLDAFVTKVDAAGSGLLYSTFLGSGADDHGVAIAVDSGGNAYIVGGTTSTDYPVTLGAYDMSHNGDTSSSLAYDAFVTKVDAVGSALAYSTFLGGSGGDFGKGIVVDPHGNAYVTGYTSSADYPATVGAYDTTYNSGYDAFVTVVDAAGASLGHSTFLGGSGFDGGYAIAVDSGGNTYIAGSTASADYPTTSGAHDRTHNGLRDVFVAKLSSTQAVAIGECGPGGAGVVVNGIRICGGIGDPPGDPPPSTQGNCLGLSLVDLLLRPLPFDIPIALLVHPTCLLSAPRVP